MSTPLGERRFEVEAPQQRVWSLIGKVIFNALPGMEQVEVLDDQNFRALLRVKFLFTKFSMRLKGEMIDVSPPESLAVKLELEGLKGLVRVTQKVAIAVRSVENSKTSVVCTATAEKMGMVFRMFLRGQARAFGQATFEAIETRLQDLS